MESRSLHLQRLHPQRQLLTYQDHQRWEYVSLLIFMRLWVFSNACLRTSTKPLKQSMVDSDELFQNVHEHPRCSIILQHDLVNYTRPWPPKFDSILPCRTLQEIKNLLVRNN